MFAKPLTELDYSDILNLVIERKEKEGQHLDYKSQPGNLDNLKRILTKEVSSFANSYGGYLILGINDYHEIRGIVKEIQNTPIIEWINQVLSSRIEPPVFYYDPVPIEIPNSDKILIVIHIPESSNKPHIISDSNHYYLRINDSSKIANHYQIRDMFDFSRNRSDEFDTFLKKRNLYDEDLESFGININSKRLYSQVRDQKCDCKPFVLFSFIPKSPKQERIQTSLFELISWLENNSSGYEPLKSKSIFYTTQRRELKLDGVIFKKQPNKDELVTYYEFNKTSFFEIGITDQFFYIDDRDNRKRVILQLSPLIVYLMMLMDFSRKFFKYANYNDDVYLQISIVDVMNVYLGSFNDKYRSSFFDVTSIMNCNS